MVTEDYHYTVISNDRERCTVEYTHDTEVLPTVKRLITLHKNGGIEKTEQELQEEIQRVWPYEYWTHLQTPDPTNVKPLIGVPHDVDPSFLSDEAPNDGQFYARTTSTKSTKSTKAIPDAPADGELYGRRNLNWQSFEPFIDAPNDGKEYVRKDQKWSGSGYQDYITNDSTQNGTLIYKQSQSVSDNVILRLRRLTALDGTGSFSGTGSYHEFDLDISVEYYLYLRCNPNGLTSDAASRPTFKVVTTATDFEVYLYASGYAADSKTQYEVVQTTTAHDSTRTLFDTTPVLWSTIGGIEKDFKDSAGNWVVGPDGVEALWNRYDLEVKQLTANALTVDGKTMTPPPSDDMFYAYRNGSWVDITSRLNP